ncbi:crossover junction endonuclease EME1 isoform X1 [Ictalurus furcatus]|uniref:crossover junction endonuclease EME1 isoform X1 n=1 Tax=Ictalurus furcatus TaxID=66913 RepID=UPI0023501B83|nr:crossover junction endonuclease EME1 isoform X1 [Ictalurus furcatus]XP_053495586.1 crossover junction endonuclease EME1 isoform X1 [Ictalurus furcatus]XP_053495587.1 crossover junction endonuclease EME1 isoform X1 [Ictalurus furcatus]
MGSSSRAGFHIGDSDSSDSERLPVIDFSQKPKTSVCSDSSDSAMTHPFSARPAGGSVFTVSSDSEEEEEAFVPLAVRLKQKAVAKSKCESQKSCVNQNGGLKEKISTAQCVKVSEDNPGAGRRYGKEPVSVRDEDVGLRKRKRTLEDVEGSREEALRRKVERERQHGERERMRAEKKALTDAVKAMKPEECIKHMVVAVDPGLLQLEGGGDLLTSLHTMGCSCAIEKQPMPRSVSWVRRAPCPQTGEVMSIPEALAVLQVPVDDFISMVHTSTQAQRSGGPSERGVTLTAWVLRLMARNADRTLSLSVIDIEKYFKSQSAKGRRRFRDAVLGDETKKRKRKDAEQLPDVSRMEVEECLVDLQLHTGVQVHFHSTWKDFTNYVTMSTKAVAEAPFKRERDKTGFSFCLESEWAGGQKVERTGKGLLQVWKRQIQQLNRVSADMATAILSAYPSPQLLIQAYRRCGSDREKAALLSDVLIRRGEGVTSTTRRIGPELSKRIFLLMTSSDPQQTLDSVS